MADDKDDKHAKGTPAAGKGGSPASSTPNEEGRDGDSKGDSNARTPKEGKESAGGKGGGLH